MWLEVAWGRSVPAGAACWGGPKALSCLLGPFLTTELLGDLVGICWASGPLAGPGSRCVCRAPAGQVLSMAWLWQTGPRASWRPSCRPGVLSPDAGTRTGLDSVPARPVLPLPPRSLVWGSTGPRQAAAGPCHGQPREGAPRGRGGPPVLWAEDPRTEGPSADGWAAVAPGTLLAEPSFPTSRPGGPGCPLSRLQAGGLWCGLGAGVRAAPGTGTAWQQPCCRNHWPRGGWGAGELGRGLWAASQGHGPEMFWDAHPVAGWTEG